MKLSKLMTVRTGLSLICAGVLSGIVLRFLLMSRFFDFSTCFYTDGGLTAWLSLLLPLALAALGGFMCSCGKRSLSQYTPGRAPAAGVMGVISGTLLIYTGSSMTMDYIGFLHTGATSYESVRQGFIHIVYIVMCIAFGIIQLLAARASLTGGDTFLRMPLLYAPAVLWGMANLVMIYVFYAKFACTVENIFTVVGGAMLLLSLMYMTKLRAGADPQGSALRMFVTGGIASVLVVSYDLAELMLHIRGAEYYGQIPLTIVLCQLGVGIYVLAFLLSCYRTQVDPSLDNGLHSPKHT